MNIETILAIGLGSFIGLTFAIGYYFGFKKGLNDNLQMEAKQ